MPKTGSSSIQVWLGSHASWLRDEQGIHFVGADGDTARGIEVSLGDFIFPFLDAVNDGDHVAAARATARFVDQLDRAAARLGSVLLSSELFSKILFPGESAFIEGLAELSRRHDVRVVCYVRPQHSALESRWCQWGFREELTPSAWVRGQTGELRYEKALDAVDQRCPGVLQLRPYRSDLLHRGDVVFDFAHGFLGIANPPTIDSPRKNVAMPMELANLLRDAPRELWTGTSESVLEVGYRQRRIANLGLDWAVPESPSANRAREVLHAYAHSEFEEGNQQLIRRLGWPTPSFVTPPPAEGRHHLEELDELWAPAASSTERQYLHAALIKILGPRTEPVRSIGAPARPTPMRAQRRNGQPRERPGAERVRLEDAAMDIG
jgi:hypothetical protein